VGRGGREEQQLYIFSMEKGQDFAYIIESFQLLKLEFVSDSMSYITLKGSWCKYACPN
jgi:hypothetical protein